MIGSNREIHIERYIFEPSSEGPWMFPCGIPTSSGCEVQLTIRELCKPLSKADASELIRWAEADWLDDEPGSPSKITLETQYYLEIPRWMRKLGITKKSFLRLGSSSRRLIWQRS